MSEIDGIVDSLEGRVVELLKRLDSLSHANRTLKRELENVQKNYSQASISAKEYEQKYDSLKLANSMLGGDANKTEAKQKINTLIRELDSCISQLAD